MVEYSQFNHRQGNLYSVDSSSSRNLSSPRTIEEILRQKYTSHSSISKENSFSLSLSSPAAHLEQVLANSRFTKRQPESSSTPRFQPRQVQVSIKDLEKKLLPAPDNQKFTRDAPSQSELKQQKPQKKDIKDQPSQNDCKKVPITKQSLELIQKLREEVRNRSNLLEPEEPPDLLCMGVIDRNAYWLQIKKEKIEEQRKAKKERELDGCTFRPTLNTPRMRTPSSVRSKSPNTSYSLQYVRRKNYRSLSTGKLTARFTPKELNREESHYSNLGQQLSPLNKNYSYKEGMNLNSFLMRAQPVVDYRYFK